MYAVINDNGGHEVGFCGTPEGAEKLAAEMREAHPWGYSVEARCDYGVRRRGEIVACDKPTNGGQRIDGDGEPPYLVCDRHFNKTKQPPLPWRDCAVARRDPMTGEPLETRVAHWRPCRDHEAYFDSGLIVLSCSKRLHCSGPLVDCEEHS